MKGGMFVVALSAVALQACAGPKVFSLGVREAHRWSSPAGAPRFEVSVFPDSNASEVVAGLPAGDQFSAALVRRLNARGLTAAALRTPSDKTAGALLIDTRVMIIRKSTWGARAFRGMAQPSGFSVAGRVVDPDLDEVRSTFFATRYSAGGPLGGGGILTASDDAQASALTQWVAEDVADQIIWSLTSGGREVKP